MAIGDSALLNNGSGAVNEYEGTKNTAIGSKALYANTIGDGNTAIGFRTLYSNINGVGNTANGAYALHANTTGFSNTAIGTKSLFETVTAGDNTAVGYKALEKNTSDFNTAIGSQAAWKTGSGSSITAVGFNAAGSNTTGTGLTAVGFQAGSQNISGSGNTAIGYNATFGSTFLTNASALGANAIVSSSNSLVLGNNANVGIGTSAPSEKLDVNGKIKTLGFKMPTGAGAGFVFTSDAAGTARWRKKILFKASRLTDTIKIPSQFTQRDINKWGVVEINTGNSFFNLATGEYHVVETGTYRVTTRFHCTFENAGGWYGVGVKVNNTTIGESWRETINGYNMVEGVYMIHLNESDKVKIFMYNVTGGLATIGSFFIAGLGSIYNDFTLEKLD